MEPIRIGGNDGGDEIKDILEKRFLNSKIKIEKINYGKRFELLFSIGKRRVPDETNFYNILASAIQDIIVHIYIKDIIKQRVMKICGDYSTGEKNTIINLTHGILKDIDYYRIEREQINKNIVNYLMENNSILIDGYIQFRLKEYLYLIDISIEKSIAELELEREYEEFLSMLQYFVDIQEPKLELVNVIIQDNDFFLMDKDNNVLESGLLDEVEKDLYMEEASKSDLLVSSLIIMSPQKLIVHIEEGKEKELISVIKQVFRDRVKFCRECEICKVNIKLKKGKEKS